jgi:hypothetical protein
MNNDVFRKFLRVFLGWLISASNFLQNSQLYMEIGSSIISRGLARYHVVFLSSKAAFEDRTTSSKFARIAGLVAT